MWSWLPWARARRRRLRETPLPAEAWEVLRADVPLVQRLTEAERHRLEGLVQVFLDDKTIEGCGGLVVTDAMRWVIAAQACVLLLGLDVDLPYAGLHVVRVYPSTYAAAVVDHDGVLTAEGDQQRLGESSRHGYVVLSWDAARRGGQRPSDGDNVVLHEFAHQLDTADGRADGAPLLPSALYGPWATALGDAFSELQQDVAARRRSVIDAYGATNPAEFFAVVTETFFEQPERLQAGWPEVYAVLAQYYRQDPAARAAAAT
ncbi:MAG: Mlc titration factor MtfA (ptsG expression regulator) [Myxococcota bacterium]|jgi:Mlc titration factor MtfA (ptsG expression regulator)